MSPRLPARPEDVVLSLLSSGPKSTTELFSEYKEWLLSLPRSRKRRILPRRASFLRLLHRMKAEGLVENEPSGEEPRFPWLQRPKSWRIREG